ncbi:MAG TPA: alkaline phosphatase family protein, partial [Solirubrobacteraceae bacterium]|nr:alkaline phosphatase family protein [Solirubrobacteraceae bacterium]
GPGSPSPGISGPGGGRVGAVLLSPFIRPGTVSTTSYNHYSSLASWESLFGLPRLAYAATVPTVFGADIFTGP